MREILNSLSMLGFFLIVGFIAGLFFTSYYYSSIAYENNITEEDNHTNMDSSNDWSDYYLCEYYDENINQFRAGYCRGYQGILKQTQEAGR